MKTESRGHPFRLSQAVYERLLLAYPRLHRSEYGAAMAHLFRDQCRDAWNESRTWGLLKLWLRVLPDLACTSVLERLAALNERKTMTDKLANLFGFHVTPASTFFRVFISVFLLVFIPSVVITFILPESYASTARIKVESDTPAASGQSPAYDPFFLQTTFEIMQSDLILRSVIDRLHLNEKWGKRYAKFGTYETTESVEILKQRLQLSPIKNTHLIGITVYSDDKNETAPIANAIAEQYRYYRVQARDELAHETLDALQQQYQEQAKQIEQAQTDADQLQKKFGIADSAEGLAAATVNAKKSFQEMNAQLSQLRTLTGEQLRNTLPTLVPDAELSDLLGKFHEAQQKYVTLTNDYNPTNVQVARVQSLLDVLNKQIDERVVGIMAGLESQMAARKAAADDLDAKIEKSKPAPETRAYWDAKQDLDQRVESHKLLFAKIEEQKLDAHLPKTMLVQITDPAQPGRAPVRPNKTLDLVVGALVGILMASAAGTAFALWSFLIGKRTRKTAAA